MPDKLFNNPDSFVMLFDETWDKVNCEDLDLKIDKIIQILFDHPFVISNPEKAKEIAKFRVFSLGKFKK
tara:strand:- start:265 stop:471 length:207 start_codon:yes stop_codon:yes gene_type:complete